MKTTDERLIWLGAGVMSYAFLHVAGVYYGLFFILGLGLMLWGLLRTRQAHIPPASQREGTAAEMDSVENDTEDG